MPCRTGGREIEPGIHGSRVPGRVCRWGSDEPDVQCPRVSANLIKGDRIKHERNDVSMQQAVVRLSDGRDSSTNPAVAEGFVEGGTRMRCSLSSGHGAWRRSRLYRTPACVLA